MFQLEYSTLLSLAKRYGRFSSTPTLSPTVLVHEVWLRMGLRGAGYENRTHFLGTAAAAMRQVVVDYVRAKSRDKRGGGWLRVTVNVDELIAGDDQIDLLVLDEALTRLAGWDARQARIVELRFFAGLSVEETAEALGLSERTVKRDWAMARAWLQLELTRERN